MRKYYINKFIPWIIVCIFFIVGILYQFSVIAMHYIFGIVSYIILIVTFLISTLKCIKFPQKQFISLIISFITFLLVFLVHIFTCETPFTYHVKKIEGGVEITGYNYNVLNDYGNYHIEIPTQIRGLDVKSIGFQAFYGSEHIDNLVIPEGVEVVNEQAFAYVNLESVILPESLKRIEAMAFFTNNHKIECLILPTQVEYIGYCAFAGFAQAIIVTNDSTYDYWDQDWIFGEDAVYFEPIGYSKTNNILYVICSDNTATVAVIDKKVNKIEILEKIEYENENYVVTTIGSYSGYNCEFKEITIPKTVISIETRAFSYCEELVNIYIPNSVQNMGEYIFKGCSNDLIINVECEHKPSGWWDNWETNKKVNWNVK